MLLKEEVNEWLLGIRNLMTDEWMMNDRSYLLSFLQNISKLIHFIVKKYEKSNL